ncbi:hypothetical protein ACGFT2_30935 [Streptomyces sp. NPDC048514]|uniref:hypothetical protein n=1 Tax=Streptomyces sp. NPDC048514 TaxID=3365564 RepID=UPI0037189DDE
MIRRVTTAPGPLPPPTRSHASQLLHVSCPGHIGQLVETTATAVVPEKDDDR